MTRDELIELLRRALERARLDGEGVAPAGDFVGDPPGLLVGLVARTQEGQTFYIGVWAGPQGAEPGKEG